ncbi:hypothetical protein Nepgr_014789 [Nepenthes gracilis]|uniref:Uncharacterized protein n=1 Tax=Nepenthes gracilis TaxID=150966 RepID=A0AAD3SK53_NEPGR|nr:hypothetical protein Nepgr_014789 [Nepenthes gracilis]
MLLFYALLARGGLCRIVRSHYFKPSQLSGSWDVRFLLENLVGVGDGLCCRCWVICCEPVAEWRYSLRFQSCYCGRLCGAWSVFASLLMVDKSLEKVLICWLKVHVLKDVAAGLLEAVAGPGKRTLLLLIANAVDVGGLGFV